MPPSKAEKAKQWAEKPPEDRIKTYLSMRDHLIAVAEILPPDSGNEKRGLMLLSRQFAGVAAGLSAQLTRDESCCFAERTFGSCRCAG